MPLLAAAAVVVVATGCATAASCVHRRPAHATSPTGSCSRPYAASSPWNTPIGAAPGLDPRSALLTSSLKGSLTSDPTQYTFPVYEVDRTSVAPAQISLSGRYSNVTGPLTITVQAGASVSVPIPDAAEPASGSDRQFVVHDPATGDEWGFWQASRTRDGRWSATNGYHYDTRWSGVPPKGFGSRGAGVPYLAGLIRRCEIAAGVIDHALAFAYPTPAPSYVYPATKSDGRSAAPDAIPEGSRLQLDPSITAAELAGMGCTGTCATIARALQLYGMYLIDASGRPKLMAEYDGTAGWEGVLTARTVSPIPLARFRVLRSCTVVGTPGPDVLHGSPGDDVVCGLDGNDVLDGDGGDDTLVGGGGHDVLAGGPGDDRLEGGADADRITGGPGSDVFLGGAGDDVLLARDGAADRVAGGPGTDTARVDPGLDRLSSIERRS